jgi:uncharacterized protein
MIHLVAVLAILLSPVDTGRLGWVPNPRTTSGSWVSDPAHHLQPSTIAAINSTVSALEESTTAEIAVVVLDSLDGLEPGDAALRLHRMWGVGKANRDNGIVLLWSPALRKVFVSVGYGLEGVLPDARAGRIQDQSIIPAFRRNDFDGGMLAGVNALAAAAREETYSGLERQQSARPAVSTVRRDQRIVWSSIIAFILGLPAAIVGIIKGRRYYPRRCRNGHRMRQLDEASDDALLAREELLEEGLRSVDYDVWLCDTCGDKLVIPYKRIFSDYDLCPKCKRRTCKKTETVLVKPTYESSGRKKVTRDCRNCSFHDEKEVTMPRLERSSSGGGSGFGGGGGGGGGGSSFGGGSSGGGGAGRSY